jgi:hypothetical protein
MPQAGKSVKKKFMGQDGQSARRLAIGYQLTAISRRHEAWL